MFSVRNNKTISSTLGLISIFLLFLTPIFPLSAPSENYIIDGDVVYVDDSNARIAVYPHTLNESDYVYLNLTSKRFSGEIDFLFGFDSEVAKPRSLDLYKPHNVTYEKNLTEYFSNSSLYKVNYTYSDWQPPLAYDGHIWVYHNFTPFDETNSTPWEWALLYQHRFEVANLQTKMIFWNVLKLWKNVQDKIDLNVIKRNFWKMDTWYKGTGNVTEDVEYHLRFYLKISPRVGTNAGKYWCAFKPSNETFGEAVDRGHFYVLDPWWNSSFAYRKQHNITGSSLGNLTDYQIRFTTHFGSGSDSGDDVYLNSHSQADFDDVRFTWLNTTSDAEQEIDYFTEETNNNINASFWAEIPFLSNLTDNTVYVYYGNGAVSSASNGNATFPLFDDFGGATLNATTWASSGTPVVSGGELSLNDTDAVYSNTEFGFNYSVIAKSTADEQDSMFLVWQNSFSPNPPAYNYSQIYNSDFGGGDGVLDSYICRNRVVTSTVTTATGQLDFTDNYYTYEINRVGGETNFLQDGNIMATHTTNLPILSLGVGFLVFDSSVESTLTVNWVFVRNYVDPEPVHGAWGTEETSLDSIEPTYSHMGINQTYGGNVTYFYCNVTDTAPFGLTGGLSGSILNTNNSGAPVNQSWRALGNVTSGIANDTLTLNDTVGVVIAFFFIVNDTSNNNLTTEVFTFVVDENASQGAIDIVIPELLNFEINNTYAGNVTFVNVRWNITGETLSHSIMETNNTGSATNQSWHVLVGSSYLVNETLTLNSTVGVSVYFTWYANDTDDDWAVETQVLIVTNENASGGAPSDGAIQIPYLSIFVLNNSLAGNVSLITVTWIHPNASLTLSHTVLETNNSGTPTNLTWYALSGTTDTANETITLNAVVGEYVYFKWYCNDSDGNWATETRVTSVSQQGGAAEEVAFMGFAMWIVALVVGVAVVLIFAKRHEKIEMLEEEREELPIEYY